MYEEEQVKGLLVQYFKSLYSLDQESSAEFSTSDSFSKLDEEDNAMLSMSVSLDGVRQALFGIGNLKSPGPDGFHSIFFNMNWEFMKQDIYGFICSIFANPTYSGCEQYCDRFDS